MFGRNNSTGFKLFMALALISSAGLIAVGCEQKGQYRNDKGLGQRGNQGFKPTTVTRIAAVSCRATTGLGSTLGIGSGNQGRVNPSIHNHPSGRGLVTRPGGGAIMLLSVDPSANYDGYYNQNGAGPIAYVSSMRIRAIGRPRTIGGNQPAADLAFSKSGDVLFGAHPSQEIVSYTMVNNKGVMGTTQSFPYKGKNPNSVAVTEDGKAAFVALSQGVGIITCENQDAYGGSVCQPLRINEYRGAQIVDLAIGRDLDDPNQEILFIADRRGNVIITDVEIALRKQPVRWNNTQYARSLNNQSIFDGVQETIHKQGGVLYVAANQHGLAAYSGMYGPGILGLTEINRMARWGAQGSIANAGRDVRDIAFTTEGHSLMVLDGTSIRTYYVQNEGDLPFSHQTQVGTDNKRLAVDPLGEFALVASAGDNSVRVVEQHSNGQISHNPHYDSVTLKPLCEKPTAVAIRP
jgi:hypothetical protein